MSVRLMVYHNTDSTSPRTEFLAGWQVKVRLPSRRTDDTSFALGQLNGERTFHCGWLCVKETDVVLVVHAQYRVVGGD